jgi:DNA-binding beta-propeller fold protein YncE
VNYGGSAPGNFPSAVWLWDSTGVAAFDPVTNQLWIPQFPISADNIPKPSTAPAVAYNPATNESQLIPNLTNSSAIAFDPLNGYLYATQPLTNSVVAFDPATLAQVGAPIPVGGDPHAIVFDPSSEDLWVANAASDNITVLDGTSGALIQTVPKVGNEPYALAVDPADSLVYIANAVPYSGAYNVSFVNTSAFVVQTSPIRLNSMPAAVAYSPKGLLAIAAPGNSQLYLYNASTQANVGSAPVGYNASSVVSNENGSEFVVANGTQAKLSIVQTSAGYAVSSATVNHVAYRLTLDPTTDSIDSWSVANRTISVLNLASNAVSQLSPDLGAEPASLAYDPGSNNVFVADYASHSVSILNASTFRTARQPLILPGIPTSVVDNPVTGIVYVGFTGGVLSVLASTGQIIAINTLPDLAGNNTQLVVDSESGWLWDLNQLTGLYALGLQTLNLQLQTNIAAGTLNLNGVTLDPSINTLFVVNRSDPYVPTLIAVNGTTGALIGSPISSIPDLLSVAYDSADHKLYALGDAVWIVNPLNRTIVAGPIPIAPHVIAWSIVYDPSREFLYIPSNGSAGPPWSGNITVIDGSSVAASQTSYTTFPAGQLPISATPVDFPGNNVPGSSEIWVSNFISGTISIIASPPRITFMAATPNPVDVGATTSILLGVVGGAGPSSIAYTGLPSGCISENSLVLNCTVGVASIYTINATVQDSLGFVAQASTVLSVNPALSVQVFQDGATGVEMDVGESHSLGATVSGGTGPFNFTWNFGNGSTGFGPNVTLSYNTAGTYFVTLVVRDAGGGVTGLTLLATIQPLPTVLVTASPSNVTDVGRLMSFTVVPTGGVVPGTAYWTFGDGGTANGTTVDHTYTTAGTYFATVHYTDGTGSQTSNFTTVTVNPTLDASYKVAGGPASPSLPSGSSVSTGTSLDFTTSISGGTAPFTIVWGFGDGSYGYGVQTTHAFASPGSYNVTLFIEDSVGSEWNATYHLTVTPSSTSSSFGSNFDEGLILGLILGAAVAAVLLFIAARPRSKPPASPPTPFVPPAKVEPEPAEQPWQES